MSRCCHVEGLNNRARPVAKRVDPRPYTVLHVDLEASASGCSAPRPTTRGYSEAELPRFGMPPAARMPIMCSKDALQWLG